jgi:hypothetical protein
MKKPILSDESVLQQAIEAGVDLSLLVERLKLSPTERVLWHQAALESVLAVRQAGKEHARASGSRADRGSD